MRSYQFINGAWENSELPTIVKDDPAGGDPHILAVIKRVHNPDALYELCRLANDQVEVAHETGLTPRQLAERCAELRTVLERIAYSAHADTAPILRGYAQDALTAIAKAAAGGAV